jgi:hypothetical protein
MLRHALSRPGILLLIYSVPGVILIGSVTRLVLLIKKSVPGDEYFGKGSESEG